MTNVVLGAGFVGSALARDGGWVVTNRGGRDGALRFVLEDKDTWERLPAHPVDVVWTFPPTALETLSDFHRTWLRRARRVVVLGTTGAYSVPDGAWVTEATPTTPSPRVAGEGVLLAQGATLLRLAGLWGPGRDPVAWLTAGRIKDGHKYVNLAHVEDVVAAVSAVCALPGPTLLNVADGVPRRWRWHVAALRESGRLPAAWQLPHGDPQVDGYRVSNHALRVLLPGRVFQRLTPVFPASCAAVLEDLAGALDVLARETPAQAVDVALSHSLGEVLGNALAVGAQAVLDLGHALAREREMAAPLSVVDALAVLVAAGVLDPGAATRHTLLGRVGRATAEGYTGVPVEDLWAAAQAAVGQLQHVVDVGTWVASSSYEKQSKPVTPS